MKFYSYGRCGTCKKAIAYLKAQGQSCDPIDIVEHPPAKKELKQMLSYYPLKKLFNTSGQLYREMSLKEKVAHMSDDEAVDLLARHGKLIKRPFVLAKDFGLVGFKESEWQDVFGS